MENRASSKSKARSFDEPRKDESTLKLFDTNDGFDLKDSDGRE